MRGRINKKSTVFIFFMYLMFGCETYDVVIRDGMIYDGYGFEPYVGDVAIQGDKIVLIGEKISAKGHQIGLR